MISYPKTLGTIFVLTTVMAISPFLINIKANAIDIDFDDFKCIAMIGQNISCNEDNDVSITDSFNPITAPIQFCGNTEGSTAINNTSTCTQGDIEVSNGSPSTLGLS